MNIYKKAKEVIELLLDYRKLLPDDDEDAIAFDDLVICTTFTYDSNDFESEEEQIEHIQSCIKDLCYLL